MATPRKTPVKPAKAAAPPASGASGGKRSHGASHGSHTASEKRIQIVKRSKPGAFRGKAKIRPKNPDARFLPAQTKWVSDNSRIKALEKTRQGGFTWITSYRTFRETARESNDLDSWVSSRDESMAGLFIQDCRSWEPVFKIAAEDRGEKIYEDGKGGAYKTFELGFANGKTIYSLSSNPDAQAGKRGRRIWDEFALNAQNRKLYSIGYPGITWGGSIEMISTHRGNMNFFAELIREIKEKGNPKKISLHTVTLQDLLNEGLLYKLQERFAKLNPEDDRLDMDEADYFNMVRRECPDEETFLQEYMCVPADDKAAFLEWDLIAAAEYGMHDVWEKLNLDDCIGDLYIGVDVGRRHDLTVIWILERIGGYYFTRRVIELKDTRFTAQEEILWPLIAHRKVKRCCIDATGLGMQLAERAQEKFSKFRVESINFSAPVKEELAYPVRALMEERAIKIPEKKEIRTDLRGVKKETTAAGNIRFTADTGPDGHSDRFWALALAVHAGKTPTGIILPPVRTKIWTPDSRGAERQTRSIQG
jgi:phage FluMu gp28-like protein